MNLWFHHNYSMHMQYNILHVYFTPVVIFFFAWNFFFDYLVVVNDYNFLDRLDKTNPLAFEATSKDLLIERLVGGTMRILSIWHPSCRLGRDLLLP